VTGSIARRPNGKWRARYRDETGHEHTRHFDRKVDAQQWLDQVTATVVTGTYADPNHTLKRNSTTSPSAMTYSLPSIRTLPAAFAAAMEPAAMRSS
jgi:hypothetical protein